MAVTHSLFALALCGTLASSLVRPSENCTARELRARSTETIELDALGHGVRAAPSFYYNDPEHRIVYFMKPEDVVDWLEHQKQEKLMLQLVKADLPLKEDTDLFKYALKTDTVVPESIGWLLAGMLDSARVMVDWLPVRGTSPGANDFYDRQDPLRIKRVFWTTRGADGRKYCKENGYEILTVVDTIYD